MNGRQASQSVPEADDGTLPYPEPVVPSYASILPHTWSLVISPNGSSAAERSA